MSELDDLGIPATPTAPKPADDFYGLDIPKAKTPAQETFEQTASANSAQVAEVDKLSKRYNEDPSFVEQNLDGFREAAKYSPEFWKDLEKQSPMTAKWSAVPLHMAQAKDELDKLGFIEGRIKALSLGVRTNWAQFEQAYYANRQMAEVGKTGKINPEYTKKMETLNQYLNELGAQAPTGIDLTYNVATQSLNLAAAMGMAAVGSTAGAAMGSVVPGVGTAAGAAAGGLGSAYAFTYELEKDLAYAQYLSLKDKNGQPINPTGAATAARMAGAINGALETGGEYVLFQNVARPLGGTALRALSKVPGATRVAEFIGANPKVFEKMTIRKAVQEAVKMLAIDTAAESTTEALQNASTDIGQNLAIDASGQDIKPMSGKEILKDAFAAVSPAAQMSFPLGLIGGGAHVYNVHKDIAEARQHEQILKAIAEPAKAVELKKNNPELFAKFVQEQVADGPIENIWLNREAADLLFQEKGVNPDEAYKELGISQKEVEESRENGGYLKIPTGTWAAKVVGTELEGELSKDTANRNMGVTPRMAEQKEAENDKAFKEVLAQNKEQTDEARSIFEKHFTDGGYSEKEAKTHAEVQMRVASMISRMEGKSILDVAQGFAKASTTASERMNPEMVLTQEQNKLLAGTKVLDKKGRPILVYRGEHGGDAKSGDIQTRSGAISFGNKKAAELYATSPNDRTLDKKAKAPRIIPAYLNIQNPIFNDPTDSFMPLDTLEKALGKDRFLKAVKKLSDAIVNTSTWEDDGLANEYKNPVEAAKDGRAADMLVEAYEVLDSKEIVGWLKEAGYDGAIHAGSGETEGSVEYKVFSPDQIVNAIGVKDPTTLMQEAIFNNPEMDPLYENMRELYGITEDMISEQTRMLKTGETSVGKEFLEKYSGKERAIGIMPLKVREKLGAKDSRVYANIPYLVAHHLKNHVLKYSTRESSEDLRQLPLVISDPDRVGTIGEGEDARYVFIRRVSKNHAAVTTFHKDGSGRLIDLTFISDPEREIYKNSFKELWRNEESPREGARSSIRSTGDSPDSAGLRLSGHLGDSSKNSIADGGEENKGRLSQSGPESFRGFFDTLNNEIVYGKLKDPSTAIHEPAHYWLKRMFDFNQSGQAGVEFGKEWAVVTKWLEIKTDQKELTREQHEQFARGFEAYLRGDDYSVVKEEKGFSVYSTLSSEALRTFKTKSEADAWVSENEVKAPSKEMEPLFAKLRKWLVRVYKSIRQLNVTLTPEMRGFFNRMIAGEDSVTAAENELGLDTITEGLPAEDAVKLKAAMEEAHDQAVTMLTRDLLKGMSKEAKEEAAKRRENIEKAARKNFESLPIRRVEKALGEKAKEEAQAFLDGKATPEIENKIGVAAEQFGYSTREDLAKAVIASVPVEDMVREHADQVMATMGDLAPETLQAKAEEIVHSDKRIEIMALEKQLIHRQIFGKAASLLLRDKFQQEASVEASLAKKSAKEILAGKTASEAARYRTYATMEREAAKKAALAMAAKDAVKASVYKRHQMVCHALFMESIHISKELGKRMAKMEKISRKPQESFKDSETLNQVGRLMLLYGLGQIRQYAPTQQTKELSVYQRDINSVFADPVNPNDSEPVLSIPDWILSGEVKPWRDLSWSEFQDLTDTIVSIMTVAGKVDETFAIKDKATISAVCDEIAAAIHENIKDMKGPGVKTTGIDKAVHLAKDYLYSLEGMDLMTQRMDGFKDGGIAQAVFLLSQRKQADLEDKKMREFKGLMKDNWKRHYSEQEFKDLFEKKRIYSGLKTELSKDTLIGMALNMGNAEGRDKLSNNPPVGIVYDEWNENFIMRLLGEGLTKNDLAFVQETWDIINKLWPDVSALQRDITGFDPLKVEAVPFSVTFKDGASYSLRGGYYPLKADRRANNSFGQKTLEREVASGPLYRELNSTARAMTKTGHTKSRVNVQYTLSLDLGVIDQHLRDVIHDLYFRGLVFDLRRIIRNERVTMAITSTMGPEAYEAIKLHVNSYATGGNSLPLSSSFPSVILRESRKRMSYVLILGKVITLVQNLANAALAGGTMEGFSHADTIRALFFRGLLQYWKPGAFFDLENNETLRLVWEKSEFMRSRRETADYSLKEFQETGTMDKKGAMEFLKGMMGATDDLTNIPVWLEAYHKKLAEGKTEDKAVEFADMLVSRVSGSGRKYDQALVSKGDDIQRIMSVFYSFWNVQYANWVRNLNQMQREKIRNVPHFIGFAAGQVMFIYLSALLAGGSPYADDDEKGRKKAWWWRQFMTYPLSFFPGFRDIVTPAVDASLGLPSFGYRSSPVMEPAKRAGISMVDFATMPGKLIREEDVDWMKIMEDTSKTAAVAVPFPDQANILFWNAYDIMFNDMNARPEDLIRRRSKRERGS